MNERLTTALRATEWLALVLLGLMAGFFFAFAVDVAPAMAQLNAHAYITTQQWINRVVRNALFGAVYFGSALAPWIAAGVALRAGERARALVWALIAVAYGLAVFWLTRTVNVPINDALADWRPDQPPAIKGGRVQGGLGERAHRHGGSRCDHQKRHHRRRIAKRLPHSGGGHRMVIN